MPWNLGKKWCDWPVADLHNDEPVSFQHTVMFRFSFFSFQTSQLRRISEYGIKFDLTIHGIRLTHAASALANKVHLM